MSHAAILDPQTVAITPGLDLVIPVPLTTAIASLGPVQVTRGAAPAPPPLKGRRTHAVVYRLLEGGFNASLTEHPTILGVNVAWLDPSVLNFATVVLFVDRLTVTAAMLTPTVTGFPLNTLTPDILTATTTLRTPTLTNIPLVTLTPTLLTATSAGLTMLTLPLSLPIPGEWASGFEEGSTANIWNMSSSIGSIVTSNARTSGPGHSYLSNTSGSMGNLAHPTGITGHGTMYVRAYLRTDFTTFWGFGGTGRDIKAAITASAGSGSGVMIAGWAIDTVSGAGPTAIYACLTDVGRAAPDTVVGTVNLAQHHWWRYELAITTNGTARSATLNVYDEDGTTLIDTVTRSVANTETFPTTITFGDATSGGSVVTAPFQLDDVCFSRTPPGPGVVTTLPMTSTTTAQWTPAAGTNRSQVNDIPGTIDDATTTVSAVGAAGLFDRFGFSAVANVPTGWVARRVIVDLRASTTGRKVMAAFWDQIGDQSLSAAWDPSGPAYATARLNGVGVVLDGRGVTQADVALWSEGYQSSTTAGTITVTAVWCTVDFQPPA